MDSKKRPASVDEYIAGFPADVQVIMQKLRQVIRESAPEAVEKISYSMPGYSLNGMLVWFGGHANHIGFYPTGEGIEAFKDELSAYHLAKGTVQFPLDQPLPYDLVRKVVQYRVARNKKKKA